MAAQNFDDLARHLTTTITDESAEHLLPHLRWELGHILYNIDWLSVSARDLLSVLAALIPLHAAFLAGTSALDEPPPGGPRGVCKIHLVR